MKKFIRCLALCALCIGLLLPMGARASDEAPYQSYTVDKWGNTVPAPNGYLPTRSLGGAQLGCGKFSDPEDLFYSEARHEVYVTDTGNGRIVVLSDKLEFLEEISVLTGKNGEEYRLNGPRGVFVLDDGTIYVADTGNQKVVVCTRGVLLSALPTPESNLLPENFNYQPTKVVVDDHGRVYVLSKGTYQGLIYMEPDGSFIKFFGPNEVEMTFKRQMQKLWKTILSDDAAATMQAFNPIEYGNIFLGGDSFIYATAAGSENGAKMMTKLNPLGIDCLPFKWSTGGILFTDVTVDSHGVMTLLDTNYGRIYQFNESGTMMFSLGGLGSQKGLFQRAVSVIEVGDNLYVLDGDKNTITEFTLTQFGSMVREAIALYDAGLYEESIGPWQEVIRHDANFLVAYTGLGKAYYQLQDYDRAMYYYKLANDRANYSEAFREASLLQMRASFGYIVLGAAVLAAAVLAARRIRWSAVFRSVRRRKKDGPGSGERG